jgi:hypothetical protein
VNYAVNLTFPANFTNGVDAADHVYLYELGIDWDRDGTYDVIRNGSFVGYEDDRIRLGFTVSKGTTAASVAVSNAYTYNIYSEHVVIPEPATVGLFGTAAGLVLLLRRRIRS